MDDNIVHKGLIYIINGNDVVHKCQFISVETVSLEVSMHP